MTSGIVTVYLPVFNSFTLSIGVIADYCQIAHKNERTWYELWPVDACFHTSSQGTMYTCTCSKMRKDP